VDLTDPAYNAVAGAAYTVASEANRAITLERLSARQRAVSVRKVFEARQDRRSEITALR
jgi:hypothetical protein